MKERPILFSGQMVNAILDGRKTQTRRVVKPQPEQFDGRAGGEWCGWPVDKDGSLYKCPYGQPGDRLWVKETWRPRVDHDQWDCVEFRSDGALLKPRFRDENDGHRFSEMCDSADMRWKPSIHMPRWASRTTLEITDVRVERLQDIDDKDATAEGIDETQDTFSVKPGQCVLKSDGATAKHAFRYLWDSINAKAHPWSSNPWVWAISFKRVKP